jgi:hypothetical protein
MAERKKKPGRPPKGDAPQDRTTDRHKNPRKAFHLSPELLDAFERYLGSFPHRLPEAEVLRAALEDFLRGKGYWPPPLPPASDS